jgi:hypothetical protein
LDQFSFYFSFYGLLLGLSVAEVASKALNVIGARRKVRFGWLTPMLAAFLFLDITSFWLFAWAVRESITIGWASVYLGLVIALTYYFAAGLVFPRDISEWTDLDAYYWRHKRLVIGGLLIPNVIAFVQGFAVRRPDFADIDFWIPGVLTYWPPVVVLLFSKSRRLDLAMLAVLIIGYLANTVTASWIASS